MKRTLSVILSVCLLAGLASGCKGGSSPQGGTGDIPMGRYIEERGEVLSGLNRVYDFKSTGGGGVTFIGLIVLDEQTGAGRYSRYTVPAGGGAATVEEIPNLGEFTSNGVRSISESADGTLYILYYKEGDGYLTGAAKSVNGGPFEKLAVEDLAPSGDGAQAGGGTSVSSMGGRVSMGGGVDETAPDEDAPDYDSSLPEDEEDTSGDTPIVFTESGQPGKMATGILALDDGFLILYGDKGVSRYDGDGRRMAEYIGVSYSFNTAVAGDSLILGGSDGASLLSYELSTGKQNGTYTYDGMSMNIQVAGDAENLYLADSTGIYSRAKGSALWEKLVDGDLTSLVMPNQNIAALAADQSGGFTAVLSGRDSSQLMRYTYSADTPTNPDTELTIFGLHDNSTVRQTIGEFQRQHPNVRVNFRVGMDGGSAATAEDVIRALNTELLAGKGPDLLLLDGLPLESYVEKGVLADLTGFVKGQDALLTNLLDAYEKDGKLYGVPSRFTFPVMMGAGADVDSITSLQALVERVKRDQGGTPPFLRPSEDLWSEEGVGILMDYYDACAGDWLGADGAIDQEALAEYLSAMAELDKAMKEHTPQLGGAVSFVTMSVSSSGGYEEINMGSSDLRGGKALFHTQEMAGIFALSFISQNLGNMEGQKLAPLFGGVAYTPKGGMGLNAAGKQQDLAGDFLEMLLSPTVQDNYLYDGYPVNSGSLDKLVQDTLRGDADMGFVALCKGLSAPLLTDQVIRDAVEEQMKSLASGGITPAEAAANVVEKTRLYLAE